MEELKRQVEKPWRNHGHGHHLVLIPCPLQGHLPPMLHLADLLLSDGFSVTVIQIPSRLWESLNPVPPSFPSLSFVPISGNADPNHDYENDALSAGSDVMSFLLKLNSKFYEPLRACLDRVGSDRGPVSCVIHDAVLYFPVDAVRDSGIPRFVLRTSTAANFLGLSLLNQKGFLPPQESKLQEGLRDLPSVRIKDLPLFDKCSQESTNEVLIKIHEATKSASAIIWNTLTCLEKSSLDKIRESLSIPIFPIGPLHKLSAKIGNVSWGARNWRRVETEFGVDEDGRCIEWLDLQMPGSVLYVSFGSLVTLRECEMTEIALGLAESGQPFLWVIRAGPPNSVRDIVATCGRGKITRWAPQRDVLAHRSVGCFWTHCGWNSTLESMSEGVLMLCWPNVGDQRMVSGLVTEVWKVGLELEINYDPIGSESTIIRSRVASTTRRIMSGKEEGRDMKRRAEALKEEIGACLEQGGSSRDFLGKLVKFIHRLDKR